MNRLLNPGQNDLAGEEEERRLGKLLNFSKKRRDIKEFSNKMTSNERAGRAGDNIA